MTSQIDVTKPIFGTPTTQSVRDNFTTAHNEITTLQNQTAGSPFLPLAGGRMSGQMYLFNDPTDAMMPATKGYVDAASGSGGGGLPEAPSDANTYGRHQGAWASVLPIAGGTLTGPLVLAADPTNALGAVTKQYADAIAASHLVDAPNDANTYGRHANAWAGVLPITGGRVTGSTSIGPAIPATINTSNASLVLNQAYIIGPGNYNINAFVDNGTTPAWRYASAGPAFSIGPGGTSNANLCFSIALSGALNAAITWGPPLQLDYKGNMIAAGGPVIPTDVLAPTVSASEYVVKSAGHYAFNAYLAAPPQWKYLQNGFAGYIFQDSSGTGQIDIGVWPSGNAGGAVAAAAVATLTINGQWSAGSFLATTGRIVSANSANNPAVAVWDQSANAAACMYLQPDSALMFSSAQGDGAPVAPVYFGVGRDGTMNLGNTLQCTNGWGIRFTAGVPWGSSNAVAFGYNFTPGLVRVSVDGGALVYDIANASDERMKTDIAPSTFDCLATVRSLPLHEFRWLDVPDPSNFPAADTRAVGEKVRVGMIAQRVHELFPEGIRPGDDHADKLGVVWDIERNVMLALLIGAVQQLATLVAERPTIQ